MQKRKNFLRSFLLLTLTWAAGAVLPRPQPAQAAPLYGSATSIVISEFRTVGPAGASDEFIELYNPTAAPVTISGWKIMGSSSGGSISSRATLGAVTLQPGQYYLLVNSGASSALLALADATYASGIANDGGIALTLSDQTTVIDQVGMSAGSAYKEGVFLTPLTTNTNQSYERKLGGAADSCEDLNDNSADFQLISPSSPQNSSAPARLCGGNADLSLTQSVSNAAPNVGDNVTFSITVNNSGPGDARYVQVKDVLPIGLSFQSAAASLGTYSDVSGIWDVGTLAAGSSATLNIMAAVSMGGTKTIWAEVWNSYDFDSDSTPGNSSTTEDDDDSATVVPPTAGTADVTIQKNVNNASPNVGDNVVFSITVSNAGPDSATNVIVKDLLNNPSQLAYVSSDGGAYYNSATGFWQAGQIDPGQSKTLKITAQVASVGAKTNTAEIISLEQLDPTVADHSASVAVTPGGGIADLHLEQWAVKSTSTAGYVDLFIKVSNCTVNTPGPYYCDLANNYNATNVEVTSELPAGLSFVSYSDPDGGTYDKDTGIWKAGAVDEGQSKTLKITARVNASSGRTNVAEIARADQVDPDSTPGNGLATEDDYAAVTVGSADLSLTKSMDNVSPTAGQNVVFTIRVSNAGPDAATGVTVKDLLPSNYAYVSDNAGGAYNPYAGIWNVGSLTNGASATLNVTATLTTTPATVNWAEVWTSDQVDIDSIPGNNSRSTDDDASAPSADLRLSMSVSDPYPGLSESSASFPFTYVLTLANDGTVGATNVEVRDKLPAGISYVSCSVSAGQTCSYSSSNGVVWKIPALATGAAGAQTAIITAKLTRSGATVNAAEIWKSDLPDPDSLPANGVSMEDDYASATVYHRPILINEVAWAGTASGLPDDQWIELHNPTDLPIDVSGWKLVSKSGSLNVTLNATIPAGGFFLLERGDDNTVRGDVGGASTQVFSGSLPTAGDTLYLYFGSTTKIVDTANLEGADKASNPWPQGGGANYASMERVGATAEKDSTWVTNTGVTRNGNTALNGLIYGTPGKKNSTGVVPTPTKPRATPTSPPPQDRPVINEFLPRPGYDWNQDGRVDVFDEFIEIKNIGVTNIKLKGWMLDDGEGEGSAPYFLPDVTLKPGERYLVYGLKSSILLSDGGDTVRLLNPKGKLYDSFTYALAAVEDQSICRLPDGNGSWYQDCVPTPGLTNSREGIVPAMGDVDYQSPVCSLPDTLPADFLLAECRGYGANIWRAFWDADVFFLPNPRLKYQTIFK